MLESAIRRRSYFCFYYSVNVFFFAPLHEIYLFFIDLRQPCIICLLFNPLFFHLFVLLFSINPITLTVLIYAHLVTAVNLEG